MSVASTGVTAPSSARLKTVIEFVPLRLLFKT
jgi:hypothetical protein